MQTWLEHQLQRQWEAMQATSPAAVLYLVAALVAALYLATSFSLEIGWQLLGLAVALAGIGLYRMWLVPLVLLLVMSNLAIAEIPIRFGPYHGVADLVMATMVLLFVVAASRYVVLSGAIVRYYRGSWVSRLTVPLLRLLRRWRHPEPAGIAARDPATFQPLEVASGVGQIVLAVIAAAVLLSLFRLDPTVGQRTGIVPTATRTIELGATFILVVLAIYAVVEAIAWKFLTPDAARMVMRRELTDEHAADLYRMAREQRKQRKRLER